MTPIRLLPCLAAAVLLLHAHPAHAQVTSTTSVSNAKELDPADPRAQRASAFATLLVKAEADEAIEYLKTHAAKGSPAATAAETQLKDLHAMLATRFAVDRVVEGPGDEVLVLLNNATGGRGGRMGLRITIERTAPHRIREVKAMQSRRSSGL